MNQIYSSNGCVPCSLHWPYMLKIVSINKETSFKASLEVSLCMYGSSLKTYKSAVEPVRKLQPLDILLQDMDMQNKF
jgi:hypothetical protein